MSGVYGRKIKMTIFGESHGSSIGLVIDGLPPGLELDLAFIKREMERRAPGRNLLSTQRQEKDVFTIQSGVFEGRTTGTPLCALIPNSDSHSTDYSILKDNMRPGHADYSGRIKYKGFNDYRGGGHFSGRLTAPLVFMGAVAKLALARYGIVVGAHINNVGEICDRKFDPLGETAELLTSLRQKDFAVLDDVRGAEMQALIMEARERQDSVGGSVECMALNLPAGLGEPFFDSLESRLAHVLFSIPAVKGLEFGLGFGFCRSTGSQANDPLYYDGDSVLTETNNNGGILGGITNGMPVVFKVGFKPTPSIALPQKTINVAEHTNTVLEIKGRHDPCIVQRAVPVVEGVTAWTVLDMLLTADINGEV
ncbi:chorismate synthase [uncultured Phascolarctobacterium sp.]|uniref:chorismate synthase n=1 Tax=uncultured Phascolarctobacterium sp. TaxID=512296 RepID=UPI0027D97AE7|nr:chorismate synthase [uncultured Phascolarctobacterium sp.]